MATPRQELEAARYDVRWKHYTRRSLELLVPLLPDQPGRTLDAGCGTAALEAWLSAWGRSPARYVGVDLSAGMLRVARRKRPDAALVHGDVQQLPFADAAFDLVVSASSLHDWEDAGRGLRELRRMLAPGGRLLLLDWCGDYLSVRAVQAWLRLRGREVRQVWTAARLQRELEAAGFRVVQLRRNRITPVWGLMLAEASAG